MKSLIIYNNYILLIIYELKIKIYIRKLKYNYCFQTKKKNMFNRKLIFAGSIVSRAKQVDPFQNIFVVTNDGLQDLDLIQL